MTMEITEEQFKELSRSRDMTATGHKLGLIDDADYYGYGVRTISVRSTPEGRHILEYTTFDFCD